MRLLFECCENFCASRILGFSWLSRISVSWRTALTWSDWCGAFSFPSLRNLPGIYRILVAAALDSEVFGTDPNTGETLELSMCGWGIIIDGGGDRGDIPVLEIKL